jgi:hypothetical protein
VNISELHRNDVAASCHKLVRASLYVVLRPPPPTEPGESFGATPPSAATLFKITLRQISLMSIATLPRPKASFSISLRNAHARLPVDHVVAEIAVPAAWGCGGYGGANEVKSDATMCEIDPFASIVELQNRIWPTIAPNHCH